MLNKTFVDLTRQSIEQGKRYKALGDEYHRKAAMMELQNLLRSLGGA